MAPRTLTALDREVLALLAHGLTGKEVAVELGFAYDAVKDRLKAIRWELDARNTTHAVAIAIRRDLLRDD